MADDRKKDILMAAQEVFSDYGLLDANISEIAKKAGVVDSIIYHYFKNKEDLLFYALSDKMADVERELKHHLEGIIDPVSRLGKIIWFHLWLNDENPEDLRVLKNLLFECRANKAFYSHEGYGPLKNYMKIIYGILQDGVDSEVFHRDFNIMLFRNMIFGLLDEELLGSFASHEVEKTLPDFECIMDLILAMILKDKSSGTEKRSNEGGTEGKILAASERVFARNGYYGATMSNIANEAGVAEGTIYSYFKSKQDLLFALPERRFAWLKGNMADAFNINKDPLSALQWFIRIFFRTFLSKLDFLKVFLLDVKLNRRFYESSAYDVYISYISQVEPILDEGKKQGLIRKEVNNRVFRNLFVGAFTHLTTRWIILEKTTVEKMMQQWDEVVYLLCRSVARKKEQA